MTGGGGSGAGGGGGGGGGGGDTIVSTFVGSGPATAVIVETIDSGFGAVFGAIHLTLVVGCSSGSLFFSRSKVVECNLIGVLSHRAFIVIFSGSAFDFSARLFLIIFSMLDGFIVAILFTSSDVDTELDDNIDVAEVMVVEILVDDAAAAAADVATETGTTTGGI